MKHMVKNLIKNQHAGICINEFLKLANNFFVSFPYGDL